MTIVVGNATNRANGATASHVGTTPTGAAINDLLIAYIGFTGGSGVTVNTVPTGWTLIQRTNSTTALAGASYWFVPSSSPAASYTWVLSTSQSGGASMIALTGAMLANPIDVSAGQANASSTTVSFGSVTTTVDNGLLLCLVGILAADSFSTISGMTEATDGNGVMIDYLALTAQGATGSKTSTASPTAAVSVAHTIALRPNYLLDRGESRMAHRGMLRGAA